MTDKEKIRAEIKRQLSFNNKPYAVTRAEVLNGLLSFIDSMKEDSANEDLEEEIKDFFEERETWDSESQPNKEDIARHFANWQKKHIWTEEVEKIIREKLEDDYSQANCMVIWASRSDSPFDKDEELIMVKESANTIIKLIKKEIGV